MNNAASLVTLLESIQSKIGKALGELRPAPRPKYPTHADIRPPGCGPAKQEDRVKPVNQLPIPYDDLLNHFIGTSTEVEDGWENFRDGVEFAKKWYGVGQ